MSALCVYDVSVCVCVHLCVCVRLCVCACVCVWVRTRMCAHAHSLSYTHTYTERGAAGVGRKRIHEQSLDQHIFKPWDHIMSMKHCPNMTVGRNKNLGNSFLNKQPPHPLAIGLVTLQLIHPKFLLALVADVNEIQSTISIKLVLMKCIV